MNEYTFNYLDELESEAIFVIREVAAQFKYPSLLFSGGKDSLVMLYLAKKAMHPAPIPFPVLHIDTGHNFHETIEFRDWLIGHLEAKLIVGSVEETIKQGKANDETGIGASRNRIQTITLLDTIREHGIDCAMGGGRRDEEKSRAKERFFSLRDPMGRWNPHQQRPELWNLFNGKKHPGEHFRVFPLSNWTELDIWQYIKRESIPFPSLYLAHQREVFERDGVLYAKTPFFPMKPNEISNVRTVRFRTVGDATCTGAIESTASNVDEIIAEVANLRITERGGRADDKRSEAAMEERKTEGYF